MRRTDWRKYVLFALALVLGIAAGVAAVLLIPEDYKAFNGLAFFGIACLVAAAIIYFGTKIFGIGEDE